MTAAWIISRGAPLGIVLQSHRPDLGPSQGSHDGTDLALVRSGRRRQTCANSSDRGDRHRHRPAPRPLRRRLERRRDRGPKGADRRRSGRSACAGASSRVCRSTSPSSSEKAISSRSSRIIGSLAAQPRSAAASPRSATTSCRCSTGRARNSPIRCPAAGRRCASTRMNLRPSTASCWNGRGAEADHSPDALRAREGVVRPLLRSRSRKLLANIMAGLPGAYDRYDIPGLRRMLDRYRDITFGCACAKTSPDSCAR